MSTPVISCHFDAGNIEVLDTQGNHIDLAIRKDNASDFYQWFYFRLEGKIGETYTLRITNAGDSAYSEGWNDYQVCTSWDRQDWFRTPTAYQNGVLEFEISLLQNSVHFAYFAPYSHERHLDLIAWAQGDLRCTSETLGQTLDGNAMHLLTACEVPEPEHKVWIIARQHPGETMAEWFIEGLLHALLDEDNPLAKSLLQTTQFFIVPNMNPDGSSRGNLRTNAAGANLNREWESPTMDKSPEVFLVRERMIQEGGDLFLDIHGDENLPYNFVAGCEGVPSYNEKMQQLEDMFKTSYLAVSPDFQDEFGYPKDEPGKANMTLATSWCGEYFKTLSFTLEMPFKDNDDLPNPATGWSPDRAAQLGKDILFPISQTLDEMAEISKN